MNASSSRIVAVVGTGVIGRSWIRVFARAGCRTRVYDLDPSQRAQALAWVESSAQSDVRQGLVGLDEAKDELAHIEPCETLEAALEDCYWVQESGPETMAIKRALYRDLDAAAPETAILGSSTSAHDMTEIAEGLSGAGRCVVAHPVNPPHVVPVVEVLGGEETRPEVVEEAIAFLREVGQAPVLMNRYAMGFLLNRLQAALLREAMALVEEDVASVDAIDTVVRDGLGLRWALLGPFGTGHGNADGGAGSYYRMYGDAYRELWDDLATTARQSDRDIDRIHAAMEALYGKDSVEAVTAWRDRSIQRIRQLKTSDPPPGTDEPF